MGTREACDGAPARGALPHRRPAVWWVVVGRLSTPTSVVALGVWVWNDHVGKAAFPGHLTGKLSDVAGLVVFPLLVALLLSPAGERLGIERVGRIAVVLTGTGFAAVQVVPGVAEGASGVLTALAGPSTLHADPWDLLTLPALVIPWRSWEQAPPAHARLATPRRRRLAAAALLPALALTTAATSCVDPDSIRTLHDGGPVLRAGARWSGWYESRDGGRTWQRPDAAARAPVFLEEEDRERRVVACVPDDPRRCYRGGPAPAVEVSEDGGRTWAVAWQIPPARRPFVVRAHGRTLCADPAVDLAVHDVLVLAEAQGHRVVAAVGHDGVVVQEPDGTWHRVSVGSARPRPLAAPLALIEVELLLASFTAWMVLVLRARREVRRAVPGWGAQRGPQRLGVLGVVFAGLAILPLLVLAPLLLGPPPVLFALPTLLAGVASLWLVMSSIDGDRADARSAAGRAVTAGMLTWLAGAGPMIAWSAGWIPPYPLAVLVALAATTAMALRALSGPLARGDRMRDADLEGRELS